MANTDETHANRGKKLLAALALIGPGLFLVGYNIGTGSITPRASAGAAYGMALVWIQLQQRVANLPTGFVAESPLERRTGDETCARLFFENAIAIGDDDQPIATGARA